MLNLSNHPSQVQHRLQSFKLLLYKHPFAFCSVLWVALVLLGGVATLGLFNPGPVEEGASRSLASQTTFEKVTPKPHTLKIWKKSTPEQPPLTTQKESTPEQVPFTTVEESKPKQDLPLSLFGAIALGCAGGSLLLTQILKYSAQSYQDPRRLKPVGTIRKKRRNPSKTSRSVSQTPQRVGSQPNAQTLNNQMATSRKYLSQVTVLPPEQSHPLDRGKEDLAEMMDLRKRHSLASLMRNK